MKNFIKHLLFFLILVIAFDLSYGALCKYLSAHARGGNTWDNNFIANEMTADILIFGSSRAHVHYVPWMISDSLKLSCYNCGSNGMGIIFHYGRWCLISERYIPKVIIYDVIPILDEMTRDDNMIFANPLRPYYDRTGISSIFEKIDATEKYKVLSQTYKYHNLLSEYITDYKNKEHDKMGFAPIHRNVTGNEIIESKVTYVVDSIKLFYLEQFIKETKDKTTLIFMSSPRYKFSDDSNAFDPLKKLCAKYNIPFIEHYADKEWNFNISYWADGTHMNETGAIAYTKMIIPEIKPYIINGNN